LGWVRIVLVWLRWECRDHAWACNVVGGLRFFGFAFSGIGRTSTTLLSLQMWVVQVILWCIAVIISHWSAANPPTARFREQRITKHAFYMNRHPISQKTRCLRGFREWGCQKTCVFHMVCWPLRSQNMCGDMEHEHRVVFKIAYWYII